MVPPEELAAEFMQNPELQAEPQPDSGLIGGKFKTNEDLLRAYQELERSRASRPLTRRRPLQMVTRLSRLSRLMAMTSLMR